MEHLPKIICAPVSHETQRYDTAGDYFDLNGEVHVTVSKMTPDHEFLVLLHELIEWYLTQKRGISVAVIDAYDMARPDDPDPGSNSDAPYAKEHAFATEIEMAVARELGVDWEAYETAIQALGSEEPPHEA